MQYIYIYIWRNRIIQHQRTGARVIENLSSDPVLLCTARSGRKDERALARKEKEKEKEIRSREEDGKEEEETIRGWRRKYLDVLCTQQGESRWAEMNEAEVTSTTYTSARSKGDPTL